MIASNLPPESILYKLLQKCQPWHRLELLEVADGALIMNCYDCENYKGFTRVLDSVEEAHVRQQMCENCKKKTH